MFYFVIIFDSILPVMSDCFDNNNYNLYNKFLWTSEKYFKLSTSCNERNKRRIIQTS